MPLQPGSNLRSRYRIENVLGQGGMGAVYRAFDVNLGVAVAVKENLFTTEEYARQFRREATILASLRHPNLPRVTDHFVIEGEGQYLVMDFIQGEDLRQRLERDGPVAEEEALPWFLEICDALAYLHSRNPPILHRDIKPGNIKIMPDGRAMLVDFGLAKVVDESGTTTSGAKAMTPGFSPPEQYGTGRTDPRTDIYSLGATMYAAFTATIPEDSLERAMGREALTPLRKFNPKISPALAEAIEKALAVRPEDRFQSVGKMAEALSAVSPTDRSTLIRSYPYLERTLVADGKTTLSDMVSRPIDRRRRAHRRWPVVFVTIAALALFAAGAAFALPDVSSRLAALFTLSMPAPTQETPPSLTPSLGVGPTATSTPAVINLTPTVSRETEGAFSTPTEAASAVTQIPSPTPIGGGVGQIAFASNRTGVPQIFLVNVDGQNLTQLTFLPDGACQPSWSPDGSRLAFISPCERNQERYTTSSIWVLDVENLEPQPLTGGVGADYDPAWSPGGDRIAFTSDRDVRPQIFVMDADGDDQRNLSNVLTSESQPAWSPTDDLLLFVSFRSERPGIWLMTDKGENSQRFSRTETEDTHPHWSSDGKVIVFEREVGGIPRLVTAAFADGGKVTSTVCKEGARSGLPMAEPKWSPDGRWIVFETWPDGTNHNIAIMSAGCSNFAELTSDSALDFDSAWRP